MTSAAPSKPGFFRRTFSSVPKVLRVLVFIIAVWAIALMATAHRVEAEVQEIMLGLGSEMMHMPDANEGRVRQMNFNGAPIQFRTARAARPMAEVLDFFEQRCQARDGRIGEQIEEAMNELGEEVETRDVDGTMRFDTSRRGYVACFDMGEEKQDHEALTSRIQRFIESGDLSEVGHMRYMFAEAVEEDETFVVTIFSDQAVNIYDMFPSEGDAPGADPQGVPRPSDSRRILSANESGRPYGMFLYVHESGSEPAQVERRYREELMPSAGWIPVAWRDDERVRVDGAFVSAWKKDERLVTLTFAENEGVATTSVLTSDELPN